MKPIIDHIQITVKDLAEAELFYDRLMPILGFDLGKKSKGQVKQHEFDVIEYVHPLLTLGINSPRSAFMNETVHRRKPGALHHLAFKAESEDEVDRVANKLKKIGANIVDGPGLFPQHGERYYAVFFKDPGGIKYEVMHEDRS
jgi:catechol 2,3-dioxygenase-like lactoylglutathione lyase family enzyme